jgi:hypothetical protein
VSAAREAGIPPETSLAVARAHAAFGRFEEARSVLERLSGSTPGASALVVATARLLHRWRDTPADLRTAMDLLVGLDRAGRLPPGGQLELALCANRLAELSLASGDGQTAARSAERGLAAVVRSRERPDFTGLALQGSLYARLAAARALEGDRKGVPRLLGAAARALAIAIDRHEPPAESARMRARRLLAEVLEVLGQDAAAADRLREVLAAEPEPADARDLRLRIRTLEGD